MPRLARTSALANSHLWTGLIGVVAVFSLLYLLVNEFGMPAYTRHGAGVAVPRVLRQDFSAAQSRLEGDGFVVQKMTRRFDPARPRGEVVEQEPLAGTEVKPGRVVYLTVNEGVRPRVRVPSLVGASLREARSRIQGLGLRVAEERPDTIPSPYKNTVTQQTPAIGDSVATGARVTLWYSTGPSDTYETVPNVVGMSIREARAELLRNRLRALVVDAKGMDGESMLVVRQSREPGTSVRGGYEVRLFVTEQVEDLPALEEDR